MTTTLAGLAALPKPQIIETLDVAAILQAKRDDLVARAPYVAPIIDLESEPLRRSLEENTYREFLLRGRINDTYQQTLVALASGANLDALAGFYDVTRLALESDDHFRERIVLEIAGRSPGGTAPRYKAKALGASIDVRDAIVWREALTPIINVAVISTAIGGVASNALLTTVREALNNSSVRMVNDTIVVRGAVSITQAIAADIWLLPDTPLAVFDGLAASLLAAWEAEAGLGFDLTHAWITARLMKAGVQRVDVVAPIADISLSPYEALALGPITLTNKGRAQ
jgi:phage-related baseplate assembly protein